MGIQSFVTDDRIRDAIDEAAAALKESGADVIQSRHDFDPSRFRTASAVYAVLASQLIINPRKQPSSSELSSALESKYALRKSLDAMLDDAGADAWVFPATSCLPFFHNPRYESIPLTVDGSRMQVPYWKAMLPYIVLPSVTGHPVVTMPVAVA